LPLVTHPDFLSASVGTALPLDIQVKAMFT
jgi:hypothetical protein